MLTVRVHCEHTHTGTHSDWPLLQTQRGIKSKYQSLVGAEKLNFDPKQLSIVEQLQGLQHRLDGYDPTSLKSDPNTGLLNKVCVCIWVVLVRSHDYHVTAVVWWFEGS